MKIKKQDAYRSPDVKIIELAPRRVMCQSIDSISTITIREGLGDEDCE